MSYYLTKDISFEAGHRLMNYNGKCKYLHGHNYVLTAHLSSHELDEVGFVRDFGEVKEIIKAYIDEHIDHGMMLNSEDVFWIEVLQNQGQKIYIMDGNPTAENMAEHFFTLFKKDIPELISIEITETPTSKASYGD